MLVQKVQGTWAPEILRLRCTHGDVKEYWTKQIQLKLWGHLFVFWVGVIPKVDCTVLLVQSYIR